MKPENNQVPWVLFFFWFNKPVSDETTSSKKVKWQSEHKSILFLVVSIDVA